jgi:hypothetical protein
MSGTTWKILAVVAVLAIVFVAVANGVVYFGFRNLDLSHPSSDVAVLAASVSHLERQAREETIAARKFDHSSIGFDPAERKLLELRRDMAIYESIHKRLPVDFAELLSIGLPPSRNESAQNLGKECRIIALAANSGILNCDGWEPRSATDLNSLVDTFEPHTERFYEIGGHVLLYIPSPAIGIPLPTGAKN